MRAKGALHLLSGAKKDRAKSLEIYALRALDNRNQYISSIEILTLEQFCVGYSFFIVTKKLQNNKICMKGDGV
jgi:hypothetical protein